MLQNAKPKLKIDSDKLEMNLDDLEQLLSTNR